MTHNHGSVTRSFGLLEGFLSRKRANFANSIIHKSQREGRILDIGCGSFPYFLSNTNFKEKYGIDGYIHAGLIKKNEKTILLKQMNIEENNFPFSNNFFDVITLLAVYEHINHHNLNHVLKEVYRVLKKNGNLIITTPSSFSAPLLQLFSRIGLVSSIEIGDHKHAHSPQEVIDNLTEAGFKKENIASGYFELIFNMWFVAKKV